LWAGFAQDCADRTGARLGGSSRLMPIDELMGLDVQLREQPLIVAEFDHQV
jgi:hypothetical protein